MPGDGVAASGDVISQGGVPAPKPHCVVSSLTWVRFAYQGTAAVVPEEPAKEAPLHACDVLPPGVKEDAQVERALRSTLPSDHSAL